MSKNTDKTSDKKDKKKPVPGKPRQAPAIVEGIKPLDTASLLRAAGDEELRILQSKSLAVWAQTAGLKVDGHLFSFDEHRYLLPIYLDRSPEMVWQKAAQLGATVYLLLKLLHYCRYKTVKTALYFPTSDGVETLSKDRLGPLLRSNEELFRNVSDGKDGGVDTLGLKHIRNINDEISSLYMLFMGGRASKDSVPLDVLAFDEVRLVEERDIDQCMERISHSTVKNRTFMSTSGLPSRDINKRFIHGTQLTWHSKCNCTDGVVLADNWPDCIVERKGEVFYRCPKCKYIITDPQNGCYVAHNPRGDYPSYSVSQLESKFISAKDIWTFYKRTTNMQEFYNAKLGRPYIDEKARPITEDVFNSCINPDINWAVHDRGNKAVRAMGVDQHSGNCYATILEKGKDGKKKIVHFEIIESDNPRYWKTNKVTGAVGPTSPFGRLYEMMHEFNVGICVVDAMPNANEAQEFARSFPGKVFIAWYRDTGADLVLWQDKTVTKEAIRKGSRELRLKWQVTINRFMALDYALRMFAEGVLQLPPPGKLLQVVRSEESGMFETEAIIERFKKHVCSVVKQEKVLNDETGKFKMEFVYLSGDPHSLHSYSYANIALERVKNNSMWVL
jgi:hypothetical protein